MPAKMVKRLEKILDGQKDAEQAVVPCAKVDIGGGVLVEKSILNMLDRSCQTGPGKYARALLRHIFSQEDLKGKFLFGMRNNVQKDRPVKEALDSLRLNSLIAHTCGKFPGVNLHYVKNSLASYLARECK